jgi:acetyltransferase-like isoleucine patch superfamily enzyme
MFKSVGKYTYGTNSFTSSVRQFTSHADKTEAGVIVGSFVSIGLGAKFFPTEGVAHEYKTFTSYPFGNIHNEVFSNIVVPPKVSTRGDIIIGSDVWFGENVTVMSGVTIGHGAIIAANSHIHKNVDPYSIIGGNPAKLIKYRFSQEIIDEMLKIKWWDLPDPIINEILPILQQIPTMELIQEMKSVINKRIGI